MTETPSTNVRTLTMVTHLSAFATFLLPFAGNIIGPLVVWLLKRDESSEVNGHGKAVLNFQITLPLIFGLGSVILSATIILIPLAWILALVGLIAFLWYTIQGAIKANEGTLIKYPFSIEFIK